MLKVSQNDLSLITPTKGGQDTFSTKVESFLESRGYKVPAFSDREKSSLKESAISYWRENKHENLTEAAWLYAYCAAMKIDLDLTFKR